MDIIPYLKLAIEKEASDVYFIPDSPARLKIEGKVAPVGKALITNDMTWEIVRDLLNEEQRAAFASNLEIDFAIAPVECGSARFRVNAYHQKGVIALVMRYVKAKVPNLEALNLPDILKELVLRKRGLILMTGATNSGKTTTLAGMLDYRNEQQAGHILTIEDPIEFIHTHKKSLISQRELGLDTHTYAKALRSSVRESPDVILIGELRDLETMEAALELCNTGHLTISTMHASNSYQTLQRIVNLFPETRHRELFMDLSLNLVGIISQRLVMGKDQKRVPAVEVLVNTPYVADLILKGKIDDLKEAMKSSTVKGMQNFDSSLIELYKSGRITYEEALQNADSRTNLDARINFG